MKKHWSLLSIFLRDPFSLKFILGVIVGLGFSISIILATIGIMDGFSLHLRKGLKAASGDISMQLKDRFFNYNKIFIDKLLDLDVKEQAPVLQMEGFALKDETSKGVQVRGVNSSYQKVSGLNFSLERNQIAVGKELAEFFKLKIGDQLSLALSGSEGTATLSVFEVKDFVEHGVYEKDMRLAYVSLEYLQNLFGLEEKINLLLLNVPEAYHVGKETRVEDFIDDLEIKFINDYKVKPYWYDYSGLLKAVEVEKFMIGIILQLIVVISVFNLVAFIFYLNEKKAKEIFLIKALGLAQRRLSTLWNIMIFSIWFLSSLLSLLLIKLYDFALLNLDALKLPGDIYQLSAIRIVLDNIDYLSVFALSFLWIWLINFIALYSIKRKPIVSALRREFV